MEKTLRGNASQFFVAGELCRRGFVAVVTMGNTPNTDILCSNVKGTKFVHIQVKTFQPGNSTCSVGRKSETDYGRNFIWVLCGLPTVGDLTAPPEFFIIPSGIMAKEVTRAHQAWLSGKPAKGKKRNDTGFRTVVIPPHTKNYTDWSIEEYRNRWDIIKRLLKSP